MYGRSPMTAFHWKPSWRIRSSAFAMDTRCRRRIRFATTCLGAGLPMTDSFQIRLDQWLSREHGSPLERATLAEVSVWLDDYSLTKLEDVLAKTVRLSARLSVHALAYWLAGNCCRLRWEPESALNSRDWYPSHSIAAAGGGYLWPNVTFSSDGDYVLVRAMRTGDKSPGPVRYLADLDGKITTDALEGGIDPLFEALFVEYWSLAPLPRPERGKHKAGPVASTVDRTILLSLKRQQLSRTAEQKVPFDSSAWRRRRSQAGLHPRGTTTMPPTTNGISSTE